MGKFLQRDNIVRTSISLVRTFPIFFCLFVYFLKTEIMFLRFGLPYVHMHVSSKNGHRKKRIFSKCSLKQTYLKTQAYRFRG